MANITFTVDKTNTFLLVNQLSIEDKKTLVEQLKEDGSGTASSVPTLMSDAEEYLTLLRSTSNYGQEEFDKNILYISSSALGLTLAFIDKIVKIEVATEKFYLWIGWLLLGATILLYVLSHLISALINIDLIEAVKKLDLLNVSKVREAPEVKRKIKRGTFIITIINGLLYLSMASGIFSIMKFLHNNLLKP